MFPLLETLASGKYIVPILTLILMLHIGGGTMFKEMEMPHTLSQNSGIVEDLVLEANMVLVAHLETTGWKLQFHATIKTTMQEIYL